MVAKRKIVVVVVIMTTNEGGEEGGTLLDREKQLILSHEPGWLIASGDSSSCSY
jgi:hypothetical protein